MARMTRQQSRVRTQELLLEAASQVLVEKGFEAASVEEVAEAAGFSRGAFYSNFEGKDDLVLELYRRFIRSRVQGVADLFTRVTDPLERFVAIREYFRALVKDAQACLLAIEFRLFALRRPALAAAIREIYQREITATIELAVELFESGAGKPAMTPADFVVAIVAAEQGLALQHMMDPDGLSPERIDRIAQAMFDCLAGLSRQLEVDSISNAPVC